MAIGEIKAMLLWCTAINYAILFMWFTAFVLAHDWLYGLHTRWFRLSVETFDTVHYAGMAIYKLGIFLFNLVPFIALAAMAGRSAGAV